MMGERHVDSSAECDVSCIEVDARGHVVSVEAGQADLVPVGVIAMAKGAVSEGLQHRAFLWAAQAQEPLLAVVMDLVQARRPYPTVMVTTRRVHQLPHGLTRRELDVLTLLTVGMSNIDIATQLILSPRTVSTHVDRLMGKMGVNSRTAAASIAMDEGLLRLPFPHDADGFTRLGLGRAATAGPRPTPTSRRRLQPLRRPLVIGAALPVSGIAATDGLDMARATQLAIDEINARGGLDGRNLTMEVHDVDIMDVDSTRQALSALVSQDVDVIVSGYFAHQSVAHELAADSGVPYLHTTTMTAMERRVRNEPERYGNVFQVCPSDSHYAPRFVEAMSELRDSRRWSPSNDRLSVIQSAWNLTDFGLEAAAAKADELAWSLDVLHSPDETAASWRAVAEEVRRTEPAAVMVGHYLVDGAITFVREFMRDSPDTLLYFVYAPSVPEFRERLGELADGILWATVTGTYSDPFARAFALRYQNRYGQRPGRSQAGIAYDRVKVIAQAWSQVGDPRNTADVCAELRQVVHRGVSGVYYFGAGGQAAQTYQGPRSDPSLTQAHLVFQIQGGRQRIISPDPYADGEFVPARWLSRTRARPDA